MIELLFKSSVAIGLALVFYKLVLQQESFFATNRLYLLSCLVLAFALPYISLPKMVDQQGYLEKIFQKSPLEEEASKTAFSKAIVSAPALENTFAVPLPDQEIQIAPPAISASEVIETEETKQPETAVAEPSVYENMSLWDVITLLYLFGVGIFSISLLFQLGMITYEIVSARDKVRDGHYIIVSTSTRKAPCSFFNYIFIYPDDYDFETYEQIIAHEKTHVRLRHSYDLLLAELAVIALWFNPLIWLFKREIEKNNEYQTDAVLIGKHKVKKEKYQLNLLQIAVPNKPLNITTNYNQSLIKQRIVMMNSKKSTPHAYWKYAFMLPLFFGMLLLLNEPALAQEKEKKEAEATFGASENLRIKKVLEARGEIEVLRRERQSMVEERAEVVRERVQERTGLAESRQENIQERVEVRRGLVDERRQLTQERRQLIDKRSTSLRGNLQTDMTKGLWYSNIKNGKYCIQFRRGEERSGWNMSDCFDTSAFKKSGDTFIMTNEVGTLELKGNLDAEVGQGKYTFTESPSFRNFLNQNNVADVSSNNMFHLFFGNFTKDYVKYLKNQYPNVDGDDLIALAIHGVKQDQFRGLVSLFEDHGGRKANIDDVVGLKIHGVTEAYIKELQKMGFSNLGIEEIMAAKIHGVSAEYSKSLKDAGFDNLSMDEIISAKIHGVNPQTVREMRALGAQDLNKIIELQIHNVNADYVRELQNSGLGDLSLNQVISAKIHGLNPSTLKEIRALGLENLKFNDLLSAKIHGVDQTFIKDLQKAGFSNLSMDDIVSAKIHGIDSDFIEKSRKNGYDLKTIDKYISLKIHGSAMESLKDN